MYTMRSRAALIALGLLVSAPASGQHVVAGFARINQSDVTGPAITNGDQLSFEPGTVQSVNCAAAWGLRTEGRGLDSTLAGLALTAADSVAALDAEAQRRVALLLSGGPGAPEAGGQVAAALGPDSLQSALAREAARHLVDRLEGLLAAIRRMDPADPGRRAPTRLYEAIGAWDEFVDASSAAFLATPPDEFLALLAVLRRLDHAAITHAARTGDPGQVDAFGLACAPPPEPVRVLEVEFEVCVLGDGDFRTVAGVFLPSTGDSLLLPDRRPLREAYPLDRGYALGAPWFNRDTAIRFRGQEYRQWGMSRVVEPGELLPAGEHQGVPVFLARDPGRSLDLIYIPFRDRCEVQPYRRIIESHRVRG